MNDITEITQAFGNNVHKMKLSEIAIIERGVRVTKAELSPEGIYPVISGGINPLGRLDRYNRQANTITIAQYGTAGYVNWQKERFWANDVCYSVYPNHQIDNRFLYYCLIQLQDFIYSIRTNAVPAHLPQAKLQNLEIPVPPLSIQRRIVSILNSFVDIQENLQQELEARQQQYLTYLNHFFDDASGPEMYLGEIGIMKKGTGIQKADFVEEGVPCIHYGQVHTYYGTIATKTKSFVNKTLAKSMAKKNDLIIATTSEDVEACCKAVAWLGDEDVAVSGDAHIFRHNQDPKYMAYLFQSEKFAAQKRMNAVGTKVVRVHGDAMLKFRFVFPPLEEQRKVASKLEQMESLMANIKEELSARQKQYEYYREKLLTFDTI